jgi:1,4-dihydroxy-2-naphthoyl-CoA hydrolase
MPVRRKKKKTTRRIKVDPAQLQSAREIFQGGPSILIGVEPLVISASKVTARLVVKPHHMNRNHRVGGGILMAMADVMGAAGAVVNRPPNHSGGTIESKTNFFGAAIGPVLKATSIPLHIGRTTSVWETTIKGGDGKVAAIVTQTQIMLPRPVPAAPAKG